MSTTTTDNPDSTITQVNAAERYGVSDRTIRRWEKAGWISGTRVRGVKLYPVKKLEKLVGLR
jgi:DNA-binding transcriptional MerR regulator